MKRWRSAMADGNGLAKRLLVALILFSTLITGVVTAVELYYRYRSEIQQVETGFNFIADVYQTALAEPVWGLDNAQVSAQLDGLLRVPNIEYLAISVGGRVQWQAGRRISTRQISRQIPLLRVVQGQQREIAQLEVVASEDQIYDVLLSELLRTLMGNAVKTALVAIFMLFLFQFLVTRHLAKLGLYLTGVTAGTRGEPFVLERRPTGRWRPDILDQVAAAVNRMVDDLRDEQDRSRLLTDQLSESETRFRAIFAEAGAAIMLIDCENLRVLEINDTGCEMLGYTRTEALGLRRFDYQTDFAEAHLYELIPLIEATGSGRFVGRYRRKDGSFIDADVSVRPLLLAGRRMLLDVCRDITDQMTTERALASMRDELKLMAEAVPVAVYRYELVNGVTPLLRYISPPIERITGLSAAAILTDVNLLLSRVYPEDLEQFGAANRQAWEQKQSFSSTLRIRLDNGNTRWLQCTAEPREDSRDEILWYGYLTDITEQKEADLAIRAAQARFQITVDSSPLGVLITRLGDGRAIMANASIERILGWRHEDLNEQSTSDLLWPNPDLRTAWLVQLRQSGSLVDYETRSRHRNGAMVDVAISATIIELDGEACILGFIADIADRVRARETERRAASVFASSIEGIMICNADNKIVDVNPAFSTITGYEKSEVIGRDPSLLNSGRHQQGLFVEMWQSLKGDDFWRGEIWNRRKSGDIFPVMLSIAAVRDEAAALTEYIAVFSDITRIKAHAEELDRIAHYDALTGLPNRRLLVDRLQLAIARARREDSILAVCFLDLDGFKAINDEYGHAAGDQVLLVVARALGVTLRSADTLARLGGDEFVMLFGDIGDVAECRPILDRILAIVAMPIRLPGHSVQVKVSASIGVTLFPGDQGDSDALMRHADQAMYRAKDLGKNRFHFFDAESDRRISAHREALAEVEKAFEQREFELFYQPKIDLGNGDVIGAEALIRWRKPDGTLVPPANFLPIMEGEALEIRVSEWVLATAFRQMSEFNAAGLELQVSANLVASHLTQANFLQQLRDLLMSVTDYSPGRFNLEILESAAIGDIDVMAEQLAAVRDMGISLSLDDFGTGYSSLAYFRRLPIDILKIDQGFVRGMLTAEGDHNIVESVIRLAEVFHRQVIAEGVETLDHWRALLTLGCGLGQGYGIARPMPAGELLPWVARWRGQALWKEVVVDQDIGL